MNVMTEQQDTKIINNNELSPTGLGELRPEKGPLYAKLAILLLLLVLSAGFGYLMNAMSESRKLALLEEENRLLRAKIELYDATVDSIHCMLDSLGLKSEKKNNPALYRGGASLTNHSFADPKLKLKIEDTEKKLVHIMQVLVPNLPESPLLQEDTEIVDGNIPSIYPTFGRISDAWGTRIHPITNSLEFHYGIDIANEMGTPVYATAAGTVVYADYDDGYGKRILVDHGNGYRSMYAHLYTSRVKAGETVTKGQIIALMGNSGLSTGPHLHYEVHLNERKVNPANYLNRVDRYAMR